MNDEDRAWVETAQSTELKQRELELDS